MDRLTKEQVNSLCDDLKAAMLNWRGESGWERINKLRDLALQSLSLESVRSEALDRGDKLMQAKLSGFNEGLEEAAKVAEMMFPEDADLKTNAIAAAIRTLHSSEAVHSTELRKEQPGEQNIEALYYELLYAVGNKYPGETRHQTALRYIRRAEEPSNETSQVANVPPPPERP